ncbi:ABC transporter substrate-binding protein [Sediminibacillus massiliensis]|uniref:ABC transporter substrate-binding protein n=1 Tax=Sediminibacillus massiliensis TaxID=1926277 RepID=UPI000988556F|nr:sugar ABC transporter substrate-binding protein [Sediminibacillus massiliensis]
MNKFKLIVPMVLFVFSFLFLAGCSDSETSSEGGKSTDAEGKETEANSEEDVTIRFTWWGDSKRHEIYNQIADQFEEKHPNITIEREFGGWADYWDRLTTQIAGGNAPDVVGMHQEYVSDYARRGALTDLSQFIEDGTINVDNFPDSVVESGQLAGETVMIAQGVTMSGQAFNTATFDELGVDYPDMDWTWEEFMAKAQELTEAKNEEGFWGASDQSRNFSPTFKYFVRQRGNTLFTEDGQLGFERQDAIDWFSMWDTLRQNGAIPDAATSVEFFEAPLEQSLIVTGRVGITGIPANQIHLYQEQFDNGEVRMVRQPTLEGGQTGEFIEGAYFSITEESEHPKEAAMFIDYFVNAEESMKVFKLEQGSPGSTEMVEVVKPLLNPAQQRTLDYLSETLEIAEKATYPPKGMAEVESAFLAAADSIAFGEVSIEEGVDRFMEEAENVLKNQ